MNHHITIGSTGSWQKAATPGEPHVRYVESNMADNHPVFEPPADRDARLWRYMDFSKFVSLLHHRALYCARADLLGDPFEGSVSKETIRQRLVRFEDIRAAAKRGGKPDAVLKISGILSDVRRWTYVSCWHLNMVESAAMWKLHSYSSEAIAVQSTFQRLFDALPSKHYLGMVKYIDYETEWMPDGNIMYPIMHKRRSFAHEQEARAVYLELPAAAPGKGGELEVNVHQQNSREGIMVPIPLDAVIETIYIAPAAPKWFAELVQGVKDKYGFRFPVKQSALDSSPVY